MTGQDGATGRIEPLPTLPVFFKLRGRSVLVAGGGEPAVWKVELLAATGARVVVAAAEVCAGLEALARAGAAVELRRRPWRPDDLAGAALAVGAIEATAEAEAFRDAAHRAGVPVNVVDKPEFCDFQFGTLVTRGPLVLAVTTDGAAPVFGQAIRARLEAWLPDGLRHWAEAARDWRPAVQARAWDFRRRRRFWEGFADRALAAADRAPGPQDLAACLAAAERSGRDGAGEVILVGSGPGTVDAVTLAAVRALQTAETLVFDAGLPEALVGLARRESGKVAVTDEDRGRRLAATEAGRGRRVVWLGTGNPATCPRWHERADSFGRAGVAWRLIEGLAACRLCDGRCPGRAVA